MPGVEAGSRFLSKGEAGLHKELVEEHCTAFAAPPHPAPPHQALAPEVEVDDCVVQELVLVQARQVQVGHLHGTRATSRGVEALEALLGCAAWGQVGHRAAGRPAGRQVIGSTQTGCTADGAWAGWLAESPLDAACPAPAVTPCHLP